MNLFLLGWRRSGDADSGRGREALSATLAQLPYFDPGRAETWDAPSGRATLSWVGHEPERVGGTRYVEADHRGMALFSGRPFRWTEDGGADGRAPLDPGFYRRPAGEWAADLDGRCTAIRCDDERGELELYTDPLGSYPLYAGELDDTRWFSNSAELVRSALGSDELDASAIASVIGCGHTLDGDPIWARVGRLPRGGVLHLDARGPDTRTDLLPLERIASLAGAGFDPEQAAATLVSATAALADWPGRPTLIQVSGGRDSRLVFAAAMAGGAEFQPVTAGRPESPDVTVARLICEQTGRPHRLLGPDPEGAVNARAGEAARIIGCTSGGVFSIEDAAGYPLAQSDGALPLWLGGQGGEIARRYYGEGGGDSIDELSSALVGSTLNSVRLLSGEGEDRVRKQVRGAVHEQLAAGVAAQDVPDLFYLLNRMATWAGTGFGSVEYGKGDSVSPLWCRGLLAHQLGPPLAERDRFHTETLSKLSPELAQLPYARDVPATGDSSAPPEGLSEVRELVACAIASQGSHPAWQVLDRDRVEELLGRDPAGLDNFARRGVWRLATVFLRASTGVPA